MSMHVRKLWAWEQVFAAKRKFAIGEMFLNKAQNLCADKGRRDRLFDGMF